MVAANGTMQAEDVAADQAEQAAARGRGNFLTGFIAAPFNALTGAIGGFLRGLPGALMWGGGLLGLTVFAPGLIRILGGDGFADKIANLFDASTGGWPKVLLTAGAVGVAISGGLGAIKGFWNGAFGNHRAEEEAPLSDGAQFGRAVGGILTFGAVAVVAIGAILANSGTAHEGSADAADTATPRATPVVVPPAAKPAVGQ